MSDPFIEMAEFAGRACGIIVRDVSEMSVPLADAFRRGWQEAMRPRAAESAEPASPHTGQATESA